MKILKVIYSFLLFWLLVFLGMFVMGLFVSSPSGYTAQNPHSIDRLIYIISKKSYSYVWGVLLYSFITSLVIDLLVGLSNRSDKYKHDYTNYVSNDPDYWEIIGEKMPNGDKKNSNTKGSLQIKEQKELKEKSLFQKEIREEFADLFDIVEKNKKDREEHLKKRMENKNKKE